LSVLFYVVSIVGSEPWTSAAERPASRSRLCRTEGALPKIPVPSPVRIFRSIQDAYVISSSRECLDRSRRLLAETSDMVDPLRAGRPLVKPAAVLQPIEG
jgi:hypothetical protein